MRVELARLDFVVMIQHGMRRLFVVLGDDIDHEAALLGNFPDVGRGGIGLAQLGIVGEQRVGPGRLR